MRQSHLFGTSRKETPAGEESKNAILLTRGGYIDKEMAGVYTLLPLGLRIVEKIKSIVREELSNLPRHQELLMPAMQPHSLWEETGRREGITDIMYDIVGEPVGLGPTHEEVVTDLFRRFVHSYKDLPLAVFQIQTKFRNEPRAKSGLLRGREFMMKDMYSFHETEADFDQYYHEVTKVYFNIFKRCGLEAIETKASGGVFSQYSDEFQVLAENGEDTIYLNQTGDAARNQEIVENENDPEFLEFCEGTINKKSAIEVGNIFPLGQKYTKALKASVSNKQGEVAYPYMGCYGIGISRLVGTLVEVYGDLEKGIIMWPKTVAPYQIHLIELGEGLGRAVYDQLIKAGFEVLYDDRDESAGRKFADADLIGAPIRLVMSSRTQEQNSVEVLSKGKTEIVATADLMDHLER